MHGGRPARQKQIDTFFCQQYRAFEAPCLQGAQNSGLQCWQAVQRYEFISCNVEDIYRTLNCRYSGSGAIKNRA